MRSLLAGLLLAAPCIALACSSFTATEAPGMDGGAEGGSGGAMNLDAASADGDDGGTFVVDAGLETIAPETLSTSAIAVSGDNVFWIVGTSAIHGLSSLVPGPMIVPVTPGRSVKGLTVDDSTVYWVERGVEPTSPGGGGGEDISHVVSETLTKIASGSTTATVLLTSGPGPYTTFAPGPDGFVVGPDAQGVTHTYARNGTQIAGGNVYHGLQNVFLGTGAFVFTYDGDVGTEIYRQPLIANAVEQLIAKHLAAPSSLVTIANSVYAIVGGNAVVEAPIDNPTVDDSVDGGLRRIATIGSGGGLLAADDHGGLVLWTQTTGTFSRIDVTSGTQTPLKSGVKGVTSLAAQGTRIYFTTVGGDVMRLTY